MAAAIVALVLSASRGAETAMPDAKSHTAYRLELGDKKLPEAIQNTTLRTTHGMVCTHTSRRTVPRDRLRMQCHEHTTTAQSRATDSVRSATNT